MEGSLPAGAGDLLRIVDSAVAEASRNSGPHLLCRLGCTQCCIGVFPISTLDALRLHQGLDDLAAFDPDRAARVRRRARESVARLTPGFPGDSVTGLLSDDGETAFETFADDEPCPALDPESGACDVYASRPLTCRTFGPPLRTPIGDVAVCELCFEGAAEKEIAASSVPLDADALEAPLLEELERTTGDRGQTIVAFCLAG